MDNLTKLSKLYNDMKAGNYYSWHNLPSYNSTGFWSSSHSVWSITDTHAIYGTTEENLQIVSLASVAKLIDWHGGYPACKTTLTVKINGVGH